MAEEKSSGKWAAEAFDFLRLFQRVGSHVTGLILLEIGWALLLLLVAKLAPENSTPIIGLPWPSGNNQIAIRDVRISSLFFFGGIIIAVAWFFSSGLYLYLWLPAGRVIRAISSLVTILLFAIFALLTVPVSLVSFAIEYVLIKRWFKNQDSRKLEEAIKQNGKEAVLAVARKRIKFHSTWLLDWGGDIYSQVIINLASAGYVGLAPLYSYSFDEDEQAAKIPLQVFAGAIGRLRLKLRRLNAIQHMRFQVLPPHINITTDQSAHRMRQWLGLDALLWGSYLSSKPPRIWLNISQGLTDLRSKKDAEDSEAPEDDDPLPMLFDIDQFMVVVDQSDPLDAYIVLIITLIHALRARRRRRIVFAPRAADRLYYSHLDEGRILTHLVKDALFAISEPLQNETMYPTAKEALVRVASNWAWAQLQEWEIRSYARSHGLLRDVMEKCTQLLPEESYNYYRLAVFQCLLDDEKSALESLALGQQKDSRLHWVNPARLYARAYTEIDLLKVTSEDEAIAQTVVHCARAIARDGEVGRERLAKKIIQTGYYAIYAKEPLSTSARVLYRLLGIYDLAGQKDVDSFE